ncbi:hypothetical protein TNCV_2386151 [Trichonephila clavipes]|nr:hypothetical protein TNCV_2386151 [Trichonephila clavipes]
MKGRRRYDWTRLGRAQHMIETGQTLMQAVSVLAHQCTGEDGNQNAAKGIRCEKATLKQIRSSLLMNLKMCSGAYPEDRIHDQRSRSQVT